ncbi:MAG: hypothetical protein ACXW1Z_20755 [Methylobacter sp.]
MQNSSIAPINQAPRARAESLEIFYGAPNEALFNTVVAAHVIGCSMAKLERDRWLGSGVKFIKIGRAARYRKSDILDYLSQFQAQTSTSEPAKSDKS